MTLPDLIEKLPEFNRAAGFPVRVPHLEGLIKAIEFIHADISVTYLIDDLAKYSGLNRRQLKTLFKLATGVSIRFLTAPIVFSV